MATDAYLTGAGYFLPGEPLDNDEIARRLGAPASGAAAATRAKVLATNGIQTRHYALDADGVPTMLNEQLAAQAVQRALHERGIGQEQVGMLAAATTQGDLLVPGFGSMVHGRLGGGPLEVLSAGGVCASSVAALAGAVRGIRLGEHRVAVAVGAELPSRSLRQPRYADRPSFDAEFLRWTLSDGAGAVVVEPAPRPDGLSLRVDWIHLVSHAHQHPACMVAGSAAGGEPEVGGTWLDQPGSNFSVELFELRSAAIQHAVEEHRDFRMLEQDYVAPGGELVAIQSGEKNLGSEALSAFMFHQASQPDPVDLLGAMFVIEGLGSAKATRWTRLLQEQLGLAGDQVRFLQYHGDNDDDHFEHLREVLRSGVIDRARGRRIVRTARIVARLYAWQLTEIDDE